MVHCSDTNDGHLRVVAPSSRRFGPQVVLSDDGAWTPDWFEHNRTCPLDGFHAVFGTQVSPDQVQIIRHKERSAMIRFQLPTSSLPLTYPAIFSLLSFVSPRDFTSELYGVS